MALYAMGAMRRLWIDILLSVNVLELELKDKSIY